MMVALRLFVSSMTFGIVVAIAYWFSSHDATGTVLLGVMALALGFVAGYMLVAERESAIAGDIEPASPAAAPEEIGVFTVRSPWPPWLALAIAVFLGGMLVSPVIALGGALGIVAVSWQLVRESA